MPMYSSFLTKQPQLSTHRKADSLMDWAMLGASDHLWQELNGAGINVDEVYSAGLANAIFCRHGSLPIMYLEMPFGANPKTILTWKPVI